MTGPGQLQRRNRIGLKQRRENACGQRREVDGDGGNRPQGEGDRSFHRIELRSLQAHARIGPDERLHVAIRKTRRRDLAGSRLDLDVEGEARTCAGRFG